jgi:hypothetical protein
LIIVIILGEEYKLRSSSLFSFLQPNNKQYMGSSEIPKFHLFYHCAWKEMTDILHAAYV